MCLALKGAGSKSAVDDLERHLMDEDEATGSLKKLEGRVRALEALLLEMP